MDPDSLLHLIDLPPSHARFYEEFFSLITRNQQPRSDEIAQICLEEFDLLSKLLDQSKIQESTSVRNVLRTRKLAILLINGKGELDRTALASAISHVKNSLYSLAPKRQFDDKRQEHLLKALMQLSEDRELQRLLRSISAPTQHKYAESIVRETVGLPGNTLIHDMHARQAALSAWLCTLRQNVGSCFATAPAIIVHDEQPHQFFKDVHDLLNTGRLKRTFGGIEYAVPLSPSWGAGDLHKKFVLPRDLERRESFPIWLSPGLMNALEIIGLLPAEDSLEEKSGHLRYYLAKALRIWPGKENEIIASAEELLQAILLQENQLTEKDLEEYLNRPQQLIQATMLLQVAHSGGAKTEACLRYLEQIEKAKSAFKALADNALLKAWEYTLASFAETKADFARWNLYSSLGLGAKEPGGIGEQLYKIIQQKLDFCNNQVQAIQSEYEQVFVQVKYMESRIKNASEKEAQWLRAEYQSRVNEFYSLEEIRDKANARARNIANSFDVLVDLYDSLFPKFFQEIYDADMRGLEQGPYDDSPAGFRLLYKHGRSNTSQWSMIQNGNEFIQALASFFIATEPEISADPRLTAMKDDISEIVTQIITHIRTREFLETAFHRMAAAHRTPAVANPLENLDKIPKKPWAYTSGGTMDNLVSNYFKREQKPTETSRWVENEAELLVFLLDSLKLVPYKITQEYVQDPSKSFLMHSPTHAFLLKPGRAPFKEGWTNEGFTYTWIRDNYLIPMQRFVNQLQLDDEMMQLLIDDICQMVPFEYRTLLRSQFTPFKNALSTAQFRSRLIETLNKEAILRVLLQSYLGRDEIDSLLYRSLPFINVKELAFSGNQVLKALDFLSEANKREGMEFLAAVQRALPAKVISSQQFQNLCKCAVLWAFKQTSTPFNVHKEISCKAQKLGFAMPSPLSFADTNWVKDEFGFVINPGTAALELWRLDSYGTEGIPMSQWRPWLNGSRKDRTWGLYNRPYEYRS